VDVSAETKLAILHYSPNSLPAIGVLADLVERLVVVVGCRVVEESHRLAAIYPILPTLKTLNLFNVFFCFQVRIN